jgi:hypothetical protein
MNEETKKMYAYLLELRDSGEINMWGASSYLQNKFDLEEYEAKVVLLGWIEWCRKTVQDESNR